MNIIIKKSYLYSILFIFIWVYIFIVGFIGYQGSKFIYLIYSIVYLFLIISAFYRQNTYGYGFIAILMWIGFWLKSSYHIMANYSYPEPTGQFSGTEALWDKVLLVSMSAAIGVLCSRLLIKIIFKHKQSIVGRVCNENNQVKNLKKTNWMIWYIVLIIIFTFINLYFGIFIIGFDVKTIFPWPINGLITIMLVGGGFNFIFSYILWNSIKVNKLPLFFLISMYISGAALSVATLSRGLVVFFILPFLYALYMNKNNFPILKEIKFKILIFFFSVLTITTFFLITTVRDLVYYRDADIPVKSLEISWISGVIQKPIINRIRGVINFSIDRWLGIEGVMSVSAFPDKKLSLISEAIMETPSSGKVSVYQRICPWPEDQSGSIKKGNVNFFSLPGGVAFLYYSGSVFFVVVGSMLVSFLIQYFEIFIFYLIGNPFLCAFFGWHYGFGFVNFGGVPLYSLPGIIFNIALIFLIYIFFNSRSPFKFIRKIYGDINAN